MDFIQAKEFFEQAESIDAQLASKSEMIEALRDKAEHITSSLSPMKVQSSGGGRSMSDSIDMLVDLEREIEDEQLRLCATLKAILEAIRTVDDPEQRTMLEQRYICGKPIIQIAQEMHVSTRTAYRIHDEAVASARIPENDNTDDKTGDKTDNKTDGGG